jgi:hypothetical protein
VVQPVNAVANAAANPAANVVPNPAANVTANAAGNVSNNVANAVGAQQRMPPVTQCHTLKFPISGCE